MSEVVIRKVSSEEINQPSDRRVARQRRLELRTSATLTPEYLRKNTEFVDVSSNSELKLEAMKAVAYYYSELADPKYPLSPEQALDILCTDGSDRFGRTITLAAVTRLETGDNIITSSMRFVSGTDPHELTQGLYPLDEMELIEVPGGWPNEIRGESYSSTATVGRYFVDSQARTPEMRRFGIPGYLTGELLRTGFGLCQNRERAVTHFMAIMPERVVKNVIEGGVKVQEYSMGLIPLPNLPFGTVLNEEDTMRLIAQTEDPTERRNIIRAVKANAYYAKFSRYWLQNPLSPAAQPPRLFEFESK